MKSILKVFAVALVLIVVAASCQKEGVYNPNKKIDRIFYSSSATTGNHTESTDKTLYQIWNWDGNLLKSIDFFNQAGEQIHTEYYEYDGKRLKGISWGAGGYYSLIYDGNKLSTVECYTGSEKYETIEVTHTGNKITELKITDIGYKNNSAEFAPSFIRFFLPNIDSQSADKLIKMINENKSTKSTRTEIIKFEWAGKNVSKMSCVYSDGSIYCYEFTYDNMKNPYRKMFDFDTFGYLDIFSQNNVATELFISDEGIDSGTYVYTYENNYPTTKSRTYTDNGYSLTMTYHYEYK